MAQTTWRDPRVGSVFVPACCRALTPGWCRRASGAWQRCLRCLAEGIPSRDYPHTTISAPTHRTRDDRHHRARARRALGSVLATPLLEMHEVVLAPPLCRVPGPDPDRAPPAPDPSELSDLIAAHRSHPLI